jgi:hypothetical protein
MPGNQMAEKRADATQKLSVVCKKELEETTM